MTSVDGLSEVLLPVYILCLIVCDLPQLVLDFLPSPHPAWGYTEQT